MADRIQSFEEFWPYYLGEHRDPTCRALHYVGTTLTIACVLGAIFVNPWFLAAAPIAGYGFAWVGHFFVEHNKPATFKYPLWSLGSDFIMYGYFVTGRIAGEMERLYGSVAPARDAPLRVSK